MSRLDQLTTAFNVILSPDRAAYMRRVISLADSAMSWSTTCLSINTWQQRGEMGYSYAQSPFSNSSKKGYGGTVHDDTKEINSRDKAEMMI